MDRGDLGERMLRDFHVPEKSWKYELREDIWRIVKDIVTDPAHPLASGLTEIDRAILKEVYRLEQKGPPPAARLIKDLYPADADEYDRNIYRKKLKELDEARKAMARILKKRGYRPKYRPPQEGAP